MRTLLTLVCCASVVACSWLAVMFIVLHRPSFERGAALAGTLVLASVLVGAVSNGFLVAAGWRFLALAGACWLAWSGGDAIANTLSSRHFEGFALAIGATLVLQAALTVLNLITTGFTGSSKVHPFVS